MKKQTQLLSALALSVGLTLSASFQAVASIPGQVSQKSPLLRQLGSLMLAHAIEQSRQGENDDNARHDG